MQNINLKLFCVLFSFAIILMGKRELVAVLCLSSWCLMTVIVLWLFLTVLWVGLQRVFVVFPDHTHLLFWWPSESCILDYLKKDFVLYLKEI